MPELLTFAFIVLLSRFLLLQEKKATAIAGFLFRTILEVGLTFVLFVPSFGSFLLWTIIATANSILFFVEHSSRKTCKTDPTLNVQPRAITALFIVIALALLSYCPDLKSYSPLAFRMNIAEFIPSKFLAYGIGILFCLKEGNYITRWTFSILKLNRKFPQNSNTENGRFIGCFERVLFFTFLAIGAPAAVTFIAAVKGLARFKHMEEDQAFAEYVIIGTFLSMLLTVIAFMLTQHWVEIFSTS